MPVHLSTEGALVTFQNSRADQLLTTRTGKGKAARIYLVLEGLHASEATSIGFEVLLGLSEPGADKLLSEVRVDEFVIFDLRQITRSTDVTEALARLAIRSPQNANLGVLIRPDIDAATAPESSLREINQANVMLERACFVVE